jgi:hypothetical protein
MKKAINIYISISTFLVILMSCGIGNPNEEFEKASLNIEFHGTIQNIDYDEKGLPHAKIERFIVFIPSANTKTLKMGDSIYKVKGLNMVHQYRNGKEIGSFKGGVWLE